MNDHAKRQILLNRLSIAEEQLRLCRARITQAKSEAEAWWREVKTVGREIDNNEEEADDE